ncbi:hypothetical protein K491DRAFT_675647 [Lophiostoma macrostomum CBS 122681]|uniref:Uncharacterized protein n=1 Tax=Lophiostoma macrostomum CBS 122681 TaxID=1314788 RepID=A0A6A6TJN7_9PLEO|nr:hypothetical protein K491DRAFT_675647 [Lophiostoma macrostomum CBS 122681]
MTGEKKGTDLSNRLKRPLKSNLRSSKSPASTISAPPKAAIATGKPKKDDLHRRKNPFNEMLRQKTTKEASSSGPPISEEREEEEEVQHARAGSIGSIKSIQEAKATDRIADLERALALARENQHAMQDELDKVNQHGVVYRETIADYRRQLSDTYNSPRLASPQMDYEPDDSPSPSFGKPHDDLVDENYDLRSKVAELQYQLTQQDALHRTKLDEARFRGEVDWNELTGRLHNSEKESGERLQQLLDLKHSISALTRMESQVTDSELVEQLEQLHHRIREWVISNYRRTKLNFGNLSQETARALHGIHPEFTKVDSTDRLAFYQAIIASTLMHILREPIFIGLPESGPLSAIRHAATYIHDAGAEYHEWRRTTIRALEKSEVNHALQQEREKTLYRMAGDIEHQLFSLTSTNLSPQARSSLLSILNAAADLHKSLLLQKARYHLHSFRNHTDGPTYFDEQRMEMINDIDDVDDDGDTQIDRIFSFCVFPCLEKFGDEFGEKVEVRNVLLKAKVCCGVG